MDDANTTIDDVKDYVGGLLLRHLQSVAITAFSINELQVNRGARLDDPSQTSSVVIGSAVHSTTGLLSHACDENTNKQNAKNNVTVVRAQCTIQSGEEVCIHTRSISFQIQGKGGGFLLVKKKLTLTISYFVCIENRKTSPHKSIEILWFVVTEFLRTLPSVQTSWFKWTQVTTRECCQSCHSG